MMTDDGTRGVLPRPPTRRAAANAALLAADIKRFLDRPSRPPPAAGRSRGAARRADRAARHGLAEANFGVAKGTDSRLAGLPRRSAWMTCGTAYARRSPYTNTTGQRGDYATLRLAFSFAASSATPSRLSTEAAPGHAQEISARRRSSGERTTPDSIT